MIEQYGPRWAPPPSNAAPTDLAQPWAWAIPGAAPMLDATHRELAAELRAEIRRVAEEMRIPVSFVSRRGDPCGCLREVAAEVKADIVVVGASTPDQTHFELPRPPSWSGPNAAQLVLIKAVVWSFSERFHSKEPEALSCRDVRCGPDRCSRGLTLRGAQPAKACGCARRCCPESRVDKG